MNSDKDALRTSIYVKRDAIDPAIRAEKSARICQAAATLLDSARPHGQSDPTQQGTAPAPLLALYSAMKSEVNLRSLALAAYDRGWRVCYPAMIDGSNDERRGHMEFFEVTRDRLENPEETFLAKPLRRYLRADLVSQGFGHVGPRDIDAMAVPLVGFDANSNRLGYGGGNYDRYLPEMRDDAVLFGVAFDEQQVDAVPIESFDVPLPRVIHA